MFLSIWAALAGMSLFTNLWQFAVGMLTPIHRRRRLRNEPPGVAILKPLRGKDGRSAICLRSWFTLRYPGPFQILFGVQDSNDPIVEVVEALLTEFPEVDAQLVVCPESLGPNAKVSTLMQLQPLIHHPLVVVSDADVLVPFDFLTSVVACFDDPEIAMVSNLYRNANPTNLAMYWETVVVNADFWAQVLQARQLGPVRFALGAAMTMRREALDRIGGFASVVNFLADDNQLARRISQLPSRLAIAPVVVECWESPAGWGSIWAHQLRWARTIRVCQPVSYFFSVITALTFWSFVWLLFGQGSLLWFGVIVLLRIMMAWGLAARILKDYDNPFHPFKVGLLAPVKDFLSTGIWLMAFGGRTVRWKGKSYRVAQNGQMVPINEA